jgi:predicted site-specific integrase-resolvase
MSSSNNENAPNRNPPSAEQYVTLKQAAQLLGIPYYKLQRAAKAGLIKTYTFYNSRLYVLISEIRKEIAFSSSGE